MRWIFEEAVDMWEMSKPLFFLWIFIIVFFVLIACGIYSTVTNPPPGHMECFKGYKYRVHENRYYLQTSGKYHTPVTCTE